MLTCLGAANIKSSRVREPGLGPPGSFQTGSNVGGLDMRRLRSDWGSSDGSG